MYYFRSHCIASVRLEKDEQHTVELFANCAAGGENAWVLTCEVSMY
jgi:hypothetical protein